jgi:hypothetical protein
VQLVFLVLGFRIAARKVEGVEEGGVDADGALAFARELILGDDGPVVLDDALFQECLECSADVAFVVEVSAGEAIERRIIGANGRRSRT